VVAGLFFARYAALLGFVYIVGRFIYGLGYRSSGKCRLCAVCAVCAVCASCCLPDAWSLAGSRGRIVGVLVVDLALLALLSLALYGSFTFAGGLSGFFRLLSL
jgi:nitrate reductase NapE component